MQQEVDISSHNKGHTVGVFLYDGVELLDFSGPAQVFAVSEGFRVHMASIDKRPIRSQDCVTVLPDHTVDDAPQLDLAVIPGGDTEEVEEDDRVTGWIRGCFAKGTILMSVCTGARILAAAGVLDGLEVTTWHEGVEAFQECFPATRIRRNARWVDCGTIVTTAGVSAGIDGALHLVARLRGEEAARSTARYLEYDRWEPGDGVVTNEHLQS